jgi:hypothetical protein
MMEAFIYCASRPPNGLCPTSKPENHRPGGVAAVPIPPSLARGCSEEQMRWLHLMPRRGAVAVDLVPKQSHDFFHSSLGPAP